MTLTYFAPMTAPELQAHGVPEGWPFGHASRVRYAELDPLDHANNTAYFRWFEAVRIDYVRGLNLSDYRHGVDPRLVIRSTACTFRREMRMGEDYIVTARTRAYRQSSFTMEYAVFAPDLRAEGEAVVVLLQPDGKGKFPLPEPVIRRFKEIDGAHRDA